MQHMIFRFGERKIYKHYVISFVPYQMLEHHYRNGPLNIWENDFF